MIRTDEKEWYRQFWPWFLMALPATAIIACLYTVYLIQHNPLSMVNKDYYQEGLTINKNIDEIKRAQGMGLKATIEFDVVPPGDNRQINVSLKSTQPIRFPSTLTLQFNHPVDDAKDMSFDLHKLPDNSFRIDHISPQQWQLIAAEKHWYVQLQSTRIPSPGKTVMDWLLQGETDQSHFNHITLDASGG